MIMKRNSSFSTKSIWAGMKYMQTVLPAGPEREIRSYIPVKQDYSPIMNRAGFSYTAASW